MRGNEMPKIEPFNYDQLHTRLTGQILEEATPAAIEELVKKLNEVIDVVNEVSSTRLPSKRTPK